MRELLTGKLWTGNAHEARDLATLSRLQVRVVVDLAIEEPPAVLPREIAYFRCPIEDGETASSDMLELAVLLSSQLVKNKMPTLIACSAGLSRSPAIAAAAISLSCGQTLHDALLRVSRYGPTDLSPGLLSIVAVTCKHLAS